RGWRDNPQSAVALLPPVPDLPERKCRPLRGKRPAAPAGWQQPTECRQRLTAHGLPWLPIPALCQILPPVPDQKSAVCSCSPFKSQKLLELLWQKKQTGVPRRSTNCCRQGRSVVIFF